MIGDIAAGQGIRQRYEIVRIALLHIEKVANRIIVGSLTVGKTCQDSTFERCRHHSIVLLVDERRVDQLAAATKFLIEDLYASVSLSKHVERLLIWVQQQSTRFIGRSEELLRRVESGMNAKCICDQSGP